MTPFDLTAWSVPRLCYASAEMSRVSVIIPNWNRRELLAACLDALSEQSDTGHGVIVVDNGSRDGSAELVRSRYPHVRLVALERNTGFAAAVNRGIRESRSELVATLNNDVVVHKDWLAALVAAADRHPRAGAFASRLVSTEDPGRIDSAGDRLARSGRAYGIGRGQRDGLAFAAEREVFGATAGAALYRRALFEDVGLFDESYFAYVEDTDLAWRAQSRGWRAVYVPQALASHVGSASLRGREELRSLLCLRNHTLFLLKCYPLALVPRHAAAILSGYACELGFAFGAARARRGSLRAALGVSGALAGAAACAPLMLGRRVGLARRRTRPLAELAALLE